MLRPVGRGSVRLRTTGTHHAASLLMPGSSALFISIGTRKLSTLTTIRTESSSSLRAAGDSSSSSSSSSLVYLTSSQNRLIHCSDRRTTTLTEQPHPVPDPLTLTSPQSVLVDPVTRAPLSVLPVNMILRSLFTTTISSSPILLNPSLRIMTMLAHSGNPLLNPDRNPLLKFFLKKSFYAQFCAGENGSEVSVTVAKLKKIGF